MSGRRRDPEQTEFGDSRQRKRLEFLEGHSCARCEERWQAAVGQRFVVSIFSYQAADGSSYVVWHNDEKSTPLKSE